MDKLTTSLTITAAITFLVALAWTPDLLAGDTTIRLWGVFNALWPVLIGAALVSWIVELGVKELTKERV